MSHLYWAEEIKEEEMNKRLSKVFLMLTNIQIFNYFLPAGDVFFEPP